MPRAKLTFSHEARVYGFRGRELSPPDPSTYDAAKWTPPSHQVFSVLIQMDGMWLVKLDGAIIGTGEGAKCSRAAALEILEARFSKWLE